MKITFCGASEEVTGSCYLLEVGDEKILIDCGLFQGGKFSSERNYEPFPFDPSEIKYVLLTHAHQDHCGRLPQLVKKGFSGKIITTSATRDLAEVILFDSAELIREEAEREGTPILYDDADVRAMLKHFQPISYNEKFDVTRGISVCFQEAGHILGAAIIEIWAEGKKLVFSGDIGYEPLLLIRPKAKIEKADIVICESTYGDRSHVREDKKEIIKKAVMDIQRKKAVLLIPAFALERTQELLLELNNLVEHHEIETLDIFVDSPLAIKVTEIFDKHKNFYNEKIQNQLKKDQIFRFPGLKFTEEVAQSKFINTSPKPKVVIAGSGMCNGGRILHHFRHNLQNNDNIVLIVGFQVRGTNGSKLLDGAKTLRIFDEDIKVRSEIRKTDAFSGHADQEQLLGWLNNFKEKESLKLFLTHGEKTTIQTFSEKIRKDLKMNPVIPQYRETITL